jgi:hypothetical protein
VTTSALIFVPENKRLYFPVEKTILLLTCGEISAIISVPENKRLYFPVEKTIVLLTCGENISFNICS